MDVEPLDRWHGGTRRQMRRPVAGGLPYDPLESLLDEPREIPEWVWLAVGAFAGGLAVVAATGALLAYYIDRLFNGMSSSFAATGDNSRATPTP